MKTKVIILSALLLALCSGLMLSSCKKDNEKKNNYQGVKDNSLAEGVFNRSYNQISSASRKGTQKGAMDTIQGCPVLYITLGAYPKTITLDFGTTGCVCDDGVTRKGKIISVITKPYIETGCQVTSTFDNYHEIIGSLDYQAFGTQVITNLGPNNLGHPVYSVEVNGSVVGPEGTITYTSSRLNEWYAGYDTWWMNPFDDKYSITGTASGTDVNGDPFSITITSPLLFDIMCDQSHFWIIKQGKFDLTYPGTDYPDITVDYGTGTCDYTIYVTVNGKTYTISYI